MIAARLALLLALVPAPLLAQQTCAEIEAVILQCPDGQGIDGSPPVCTCNGVAVDRLELSCEINYGCASGDQVGYGEWPDCSCRFRDEVVTGAASGGSDGDTSGAAVVGSGLGGAATCDQFFDCPAGSKMNVTLGRCSCLAVMLTQDGS